MYKHFCHDLQKLIGIWYISMIIKNKLSNNFELIVQKKNISFNYRVSYYATFRIVVKTMLGFQADKGLIKIPLYDITFSQSIINISENI